MRANLELYRIFCEVVKYMNISKAAQSMYISQSAVTQSIQRLENQLNGKLFFRNKSGVQLTTEGWNLYNYIKDSIEVMNNAESIFSQYINLEKGQVRISGGRILIKKYILPTLIEFIKEFPHIDVIITTNSSENAIKSVANGQIDLAIFNLYENSKRYENISIYPINYDGEIYAFYASKEYVKKHNLIENFNINNKNVILPKSNIALNRFEDYCKTNEINDFTKYEIQDAAILNEMVLNGCGIGFSIKGYLADNLLTNKDIIILKEMKKNTDKISFATLNEKMCNQPTLELFKRIKKNLKIKS